MNNYQQPNQFYPTGTTNNQVNYNNYRNDENFINQNDQKQQNNYTQNQDYNNLTQNMEKMYLNSEYPSYQNHQTSPVNNQQNLQNINEPIKNTNVPNLQQQNQYQSNTSQYNYQNQYNGNSQYNNLEINKTNQPIPNRNSTNFQQDYQQGLQQPNYINQNNMTTQHQNNGYNWRMPTMNQPPMVQPNQMNSYPPANSMVSPSMMNQPQQTKQIDPDNVPSVIQVTESDRNKFFTKDLTYSTTIPSDLPPNETTIYDNNQVFLKMLDNGCSRPNHIRSSIYNVPIKEEILKNTSIPFNVVVKPFDEFEVDDKFTVPVSQSEIIRCNRCKAYISPHMKFTDGGKRFQCSLCHHMNDVPPNYFVSLDHMEQRLDKYERPELHLGSYEFRTGQEFYRNKVLASRRPHIVFAFELTVNSKPLIQTISEHLIDVIKTSLPVDKIWNCPPPLLGFMTYNSKIQFYDVVNNGTSHIISDVSSTFPPFTTFLVDPVTQIDKIEQFLKKLPSLYSDNELETETILGPVIEAAFQTCNADSSNWFPNQEVKDKSKVLAVGKIYLFHCSLPTFGQDGVTPGRLKKRWTTVDDEAKRLLGTDKEKLILTPESSKYYTKLGEKCVSEYGSGVELFLFPPLNGSFVDIATISELIRLTGTGGIYKYFNDFSPRFIEDLKTSLQSTMAFDVILKVRTSTGIRPVNYYGNYYFSNLYDVEFAALNAGNSISVEFKYDEKLNENQFVIIQVAALYTSVSGDRRVRVHNLVLPVCSQIGEVYRSANCDALMNHLFRSSIQSLRLGTKTVQDVKNALINRVVQILISYRLNCASPNSNSGQLILPETLKLLPVYLTGAIKCDAIDGGFEMSLDDKAFAQVKSLSANCFLSQKIFYPSLLRIQYNESNCLETIPLRCAFYRLDSTQGVGYILDNGFYLFLYLPSNPELIDQPKFLKNVFGVNSLQEIKPENEVPLLETEESIYINNVLDNIRQKRKMAMKVFVVRQNIDKNEIIFKSFLYEDNKLITSVKSGQNNFESPSYVDLLCHLHKEIRAHLQ